MTNSRAGPARPQQSQPTRLLVVTALYPTPDMPNVGVFVQRRLEGVDSLVVSAKSYAQPMPLRYLRLLWSALTARGRFVAVEAHVLFPAGLIGLLAARVRGIPLIVYAHGADVRETAQQNRIYRFLARGWRRSADAVATNSQATADLIRDLGREPVVIPPGVDLNGSSHRQDRKADECSIWAARGPEGI